MMFHKRLLQVIGVIGLITSIGCTPLATPFPTQTTTISIVPTQTDAVVASSTSTQTSVMGFESCVELGNLIQRTFPRQCISHDGKIFEEALPDGIIFSKVYGKAKHTERPYDVISTIDGGFLITGQADGRCLVRKLDASGELEWEQKLYKELIEKLQFNADFSCWSAAQSSDGKYEAWVHGENGTIGKFFMIGLDQQGQLENGTILNYRQGSTLHWDQAGNLVWLKSFGLAANVIDTSDGGHAFFGIFPNGYPDRSTHIFKTDANGAYRWEINLCQDKNVQQIWEKNIVCSDNYLRDAIQAQDGGYVLLGGFVDGVWLLKTDSVGNIEWIKSYMPGSIRTGGRALIETLDGGFLIAGYRYGNAMLIKTDGNGNMLWSKNLGGNGNDEFITLQQLPNSSIAILGSTESFGEGLENTWLLEIDPYTFK